MKLAVFDGQRGLLALLDPVITRPTWTAVVFEHARHGRGDEGPVRELLAAQDWRPVPSTAVLVEPVVGHVATSHRLVQLASRRLAYAAYARGHRLAPAPDLRAPHKSGGPGFRNRSASALRPADPVLNIIRPPSSSRPPSDHQRTMFGHACHAPSPTVSEAPSAPRISDPKSKSEPVPTGRRSASAA